MNPPLVPAAVAPSPLRHPVRLLALVGLIGVAIGAFGPWLEGTAADGTPITLNGFAGAADGAFQIVACIALALLLRSRAAAESRTLVVQLLPAVAGLACLAYAIVIVRTLDQLEVVISDQGGIPVVAWGLQLDVLAAVVMAGGAVATSWLTWRTHPPRRRGPLDAPVLDRGSLTVVGGYLVAIFGGGALGLIAGLAILGSTANAVIVFFVGIGVLVGWLAADTVRRMSRDWGSLDER